MPFLEAGKWDFVHWDWDSLKKNNRKMGMGFPFEEHRLGLWDLSWDLKKTISWEMGLGPPLNDPDKSVGNLVPRASVTLVHRNRQW